MGNSMESFLYGVSAIGVIIAVVVLSCGVKYLCRRCLKQKKHRGDKNRNGNSIAKNGSGK